SLMSVEALDCVGASVGGTSTYTHSAGTVGMSLTTAVTTNCSLSVQEEKVQALARALMCIMYALITAFALAGNGVVCYVVLAYPRMRTVIKVFIVNLVVGDILMALFCIPFTFVTNFVTHHWVFGYPMCVAVGYCEAISVMVNAYALIAISMDRYMAIMYPFESQLSGLQTRLIIGIVWAVALVTPMLSALKLNLIAHPDCPGVWQHCSEDWSAAPELEGYYSCGLLLLQYLLPLLVLVVTYARIAVTVWGKEILEEKQHQRDGVWNNRNEWSACFLTRSLLHVTRTMHPKNAISLT
ncbi:neuropeptide Y receptor-like, partial [Tropilaelaps mercedesae]